MRLVGAMALCLVVSQVNAQNAADPELRQQVEPEVYQQILAKDTAYAVLFEVIGDRQNTIYCRSEKGEMIYRSQVEENKRMAQQREAEGNEAPKAVSIDMLEPTIAPAEGGTMAPSAAGGTTMEDPAPEGAEPTTIPPSTKKRKHKDAK